MHCSSAAADALLLCCCSPAGLLKPSLPLTTQAERLLHLDPHLSFVVPIDSFDIHHETTLAL